MPNPDLELSSCAESEVNQPLLCLVVSVCRFSYLALTVLDIYTRYILLDILLINKNLASLVVQSVKNLPVVQETQVQSLGWEDPLEKEMATHSSTLAWKISWTEEPGGRQSMVSQRLGHD